MREHFQRLSGWRGADEPIVRHQGKVRVGWFRQEHKPIKQLTRMETFGGCAIDK